MSEVIKANREILNDLGWGDKAECSGMDVDIFYPDGGQRSKIRAAQEICGRCIVKNECLNYALKNDERFGIWGGVLINEELKRRSRETRRTERKKADLLY